MKRSICCFVFPRKRRESLCVMTTILIFTITNFCYCFDLHRVADETSKNRSEKRGVNERFHANLVKWQGHPLKNPLLKLPPDLNALALECFDCILRYCGDLPQDHDFTEVKCVYTVLMVG